MKQPSPPNVSRCSPPTPVADPEQVTIVPVVQVPRRFDRNARLFGQPAVERLARSHVMVLGMGGVGSYTVEGLARAGVGRLSLVDFDDVCITNVNRQLHALPATVGKAKVGLMADRVRAISPDIQVEAIHDFFEAGNAEAILARRPDVIVDAIDNVTAKLHLLATAVYRGLPIVTCLGASAKIDPTRVTWDELRKTKIDPLAKAIRKNLWQVYRINLKRVDNLLAVYSDEPVILPHTDYTSSLCGSECVCPNSSNQHHTCAERNIIHGSAVFVTSVFGMTGASLVVRYLCGDAAVNLKPQVKTLPGDEPVPDPVQVWRAENPASNQE